MTAATEAAGRQITVRSESAEAAAATATGYTKRGVKSGSAEATANTQHANKGYATSP